MGAEIPVRERRAAPTALLALLLPVLPLGGQTVRASGSTSLRYIEVRALARDSVLSTETTGSQLLRQLPDGSVVRCIPGESYCHSVLAGDVISTVPVIHDLTVSAWGFGRGLRVLSQFRGRSSFGATPDYWPRASNHLEVLALYGEMERDRLRVRAGRQWRVSGLGFYNFDGLSVALRPRAAAWIEAYGGRSLSRGLNEGRTAGALESIEDLSLPNAGVLFGLQAKYRPSPALALGAAYQADVRGDRAGAYSELGVIDGVARIGRGSADASVEFDLAGRALNHARLLLRAPPMGNIAPFAEVRRYHPYFELWTIWGAFSPVGFDEVRAGATWSRRDGRLIARGEVSYREYGDAGTDAPDDFSDTGWGVGSNMTWSPTEPWSAELSYRIEGGFGAGRWDGQAVVRREAGEKSVALQAVAFQRLYEFRLGEGTVFGFGGEGAVPLSDRGRVFASIMAYRQRGGMQTAMDWNQRRASVRFEWVLGGEPSGRRAGDVR